MSTWIPIDKATPDKPEIYAIAQALKMDPDTVFGKCIRVWMWFDEMSRNGHAATVTPTSRNGHAKVTHDFSVIDTISRKKGFGRAMSDVGWLEGKSGEIVMPNFERYLGKSAKKRYLDKERQSRKRHAAVTQESRSISTTEQNRTEEARAAHIAGGGAREKPIDSAHDLGLT